jgi:hypothetical protein
MHEGTISRRRRPIDPLIALEQPLTIYSRPLRTAQACLPGGLIIPAHRYLWYYEARTSTGELAATLHLEEGIVIPGFDGLWRVSHRDGVYTLNAPTGNGSTPVASYFVGNAGLFNPVRRLTLGADRLGGYEIGGNGWRGGWVTHADTGARVLMMTGDGDPPNVYHVTPARNAPSVPMPAVLLLSYILTEREVRNGCWIPRPRSAVAA